MSSEELKARGSLPVRRLAPAPTTRALTAPEFHQLAQVPPATEWFANLDNANTRRAYRNDLTEFMAFVGISEPEELRLVTRAHVLAWRRDRLFITGRPAISEFLAYFRCGLLSGGHRAPSPSKYGEIHQAELMAIGENRPFAIWKLVSSSAITRIDVLLDGRKFRIDARPRDAVVLESVCDVTADTQLGMRTYERVELGTGDRP